MLYIIWFVPIPEEKQKSFLHWLGILGKWLMLDVFVVVIMIVVTKISGFASAEAHVGIYFSGASILLAMITTDRIEQLVKE